MFMLWPSDPTDLALPSGRAEADGETVGWVSKIEANTIHVNSGPFGGGVIPLVVTKDTRITIGAKEAWFEDIRPGGQVKVAYELYRGRRLARTVELLVDEGPRRPVRAESRGLLNRASTKASTAAGPVPQVQPAAESSGAAPAAQSPVKAARPAAQVPTEARPVPKPEPGLPAAAQTSVAPRATNAAARSAVPAESGPRVPETTRPALSAQAPSAPASRPAETRAAEGEGTDGSAAVDWLLKGRR
jgi:hypothetical protein